jgi:flagellar biosynthesis/type III secretory pathway chaperone
MPPDYRPLAKALVDENNELLARVQQRARQNHLLLRRSLDLMQQLLHSLMPTAHSSVYDQQGQTSGAEPAAFLCNAAA